MLYVTTRNNSDVFTPQKTLCENRGPDGGLFLPFHIPHITESELEELTKLSFSQCVAQLLNRMFHTQLSSWDLDFAVGRYPVRLAALGQRIHIAESWHNPDWDFLNMIQKVQSLLSDSKANMVTDWTNIAVRIACYFGIYGELVRQGAVELGDKIDISCLSGELYGPVSAYYARQWGLPVESIILCCNENNEIWNLICQGQLRTDTVSISTIIPQADVAIPLGLERLISDCGGMLEVENYRNACQKGKTYYPSDAVVSKLRNVLYVSVISSNRVMSTIPNVLQTHNYLMDPYCALEYAGLLDYRAKKGKRQCAVIISETSPVRAEALVASALGIERKLLKNYLA